MPTERRFQRVVLAVLGLFLIAVPAAAQTTGTILGVVKDQTGAALPQVAVAVKNELTGISRDVVTDSNGGFEVASLVPGTYTLSATRQGFQTFVQKALVLRVNQQLRVDVSLAVGQVHQTLEVKGSAVQVETQGATLGQVESDTRIVNLPLNGRNFLQLGTLQAGVNPVIGLESTGTPDMPGSINSSFVVNGLRPQSNNFLLDGADNNEYYLGAASSVPSPDFIQEYRILTNLYSAEFGRGGGGIVNVITKSGTDILHGNVFEFLRNDVIDARDFFAKAKPFLRRNQFGGTLGGPIVRDKTFFFSGYEGFRLSQGVTRGVTVPSALERQGNFSQSASKPIDPSTGQRFANDTITSIDPVASRLLALIPSPNAGINQFSSTPPASDDRDQFLVRVDHSFSSSNTLNGRYFFENGRSTFPFWTTSFGPPVNIPGFTQEDKFRVQHVVLSDTQVLSQRLVNETRFAYKREGLASFLPVNIPKAQDFGFTFPSTFPETLLPHIALNGYFTFGQSNNTNSLRKTNLFQIEDNVTLVHGKHSLRTGLDIRRIQDNINIPAIPQGVFIFVGAFTGNTLADFLLGKPVVFIQSGGITDRGFRSSAFNFYGQDDFRVSRNLTLNFGLRYEVNIPVTDVKNRVFAFRPGVQSKAFPLMPPGLLYPGDPGITDSTIQTDKRNFGPRVGIGWDIFGNGKVTVRSGYGIFYDNIIELAPGQFTFGPPFMIIPAVGAPQSFADPWLGSSPFANFNASNLKNVALPPFSLFLVRDPNTTTPYVQQWNVSVQQRLAKDYLFEVAYVGTKGTHLLGTAQLNAAAFVPGNSTPFNVNQRRPFQPFGNIYNFQTTFNSNYNALQLTLAKEVGRVSFRGAYTFSRTIDDISSPVNFQAIGGQASIAQDSHDLAAEKGLQAFHAKHRFVASYVWSLPLLEGSPQPVKMVFGHWQTTGIVTLQSGFPFDVIDSSNPSLTGDTGDRPNVVGNPNLSGNQQTVSAFFNTAAFSRVPFGSGRFGTAGRNIVIGPNIRTFDASLQRNIPIRERLNIEFRAEAFNLLNSPQFDFPVTDINSPGFGAILNTRLPARQVQFALKLSF